MLAARSGMIILQQDVPEAAGKRASRKPAAQA